MLGTVCRTRAGSLCGNPRACGDSTEQNRPLDSGHVKLESPQGCCLCCPLNCLLSWVTAGVVWLQRAELAATLAQASVSHSPTGL